MLDEIQAGIFDGWTYEQIEQQMPQEFVARKKDKLKYRCAFAPVCLVWLHYRFARAPVLSLLLCGSLATSQVQAFTSCLPPPLLLLRPLLLLLILPSLQHLSCLLPNNTLPKLLQTTCQSRQHCSTKGEQPAVEFPSQSGANFIPLRGAQVPKWGELPGRHSAPGACHH